METPEKAHHHQFFISNDLRISLGGLKDSHLCPSRALTLTTGFVPPVPCRLSREERRHHPLVLKVVLFFPSICPAPAPHGSRKYVKFMALFDFTMNSRPSHHAPSLEPGQRTSEPSRCVLSGSRRRAGHAQYDQVAIGHTLSALSSVGSFKQYYS